MSTLSVPLNEELEKIVNSFVQSGFAPNKAEVVRKALKRLAEEEAVRAVLESENEPTLSGDIRELLKKIP